MSNTTKNSLSTLLSQFVRLNRNALEIFERINEAVTSDKETINVDLFDDESNLNRIQIPSFGYLKSEISRLDRNFGNLAGVGDSNTSVRLPDGSYRKVITSKLNTAANDITDVNVPTSFNFKNNWFFEDFLNPLMYINIDVTSQIPISTEKFLVKKYILQLDNETKKKYFDDNFKGRSDIDFIEFNKSLIENDISFIPDDDLRDVPPRENVYTGTFDILDIGNKEYEVLVDGDTVVKRRKTYKLNKLTYTDLNSGYPDTVSLKVGDSLAVVSDEIDTRYVVKEIDSSTNNVILELIEGYRGLAIGIDQLMIYREIDGNINLDIPISFDKHLVIFFKAVDPDSNIPSDNWSPGIGFYTNDLILQSDEDEIVSLDTFYRNEVTDFGLFIMSMAKDKVIPSSLSLTPNIPEIGNANLKPMQINNHITDNPAFKELKSLSDDRNRLSSEIKELDVAISSKKTTINTKQYNSYIERDKDRAELNSLIEQRSSSAKLLASIVEDINAKAKSEDLMSAKAKYRVRGFIPIPEPRRSKYTGDQDIVAIEYEYRYVGTDGGSNAIKQIVQTNVDGSELIGAQGNWIKAPIIPRQKYQDESTGEFFWEDQNIEDPEQININQVDIPIRQGESVEIRARSISEAGYPTNPARSNWSEIIKVDFDDSLIQPDTVGSIIEENNKEAQRVKLEESLDAKGVITHISDQFTANEKVFKHDAGNIFSGELTDEQTPISLFEKLQSLTNRLAKVEEIIARVKGELRVKLQDENGNEVLIERNTITKQFAGYYSDLVRDLDVKKGAIISKTYFITLENTKATTLELISRISGNRKLKAYESGGLFGSSTINNIVANDAYYVNRGKYDFVPLLYTSPDSISNNFINESPYQSSQLRGQYIYARYNDVAGTDEYYIDFNLDNNAVISSVDDAEYSYLGNPLATNGNINNDFIWSGTYDNGNPVGTSADIVQLSSVSTEYNSGDEILLHINHPDVINGVQASNINARNAKTATLTNSDTHGKKQTGYFYDNVENRTIKCSFEPDDQYTLGKASVGSYMFIAPSDEDTLSVNGDDSLSTKLIEFGPNNSIRIPLVFQFRMTDYAGVGDSGIGFIGGDSTGATKDITYSKRMGFDIITHDGNNEDRFSFDIECFAKYRSNKLNLGKLPIRDISLALNDITKNLGSTTPNIGQIK